MSEMSEMSEMNERAEYAKKMSEDVQYVMGKFGLPESYREVVLELLGTWEASQIEEEQIEEMAYLFQNEELI